MEGWENGWKGRKVGGKVREWQCEKVDGRMGEKWVEGWEDEWNGGEWVWEAGKMGGRRKLPISQILHGRLGQNKHHTDHIFRAY